MVLRATPLYADDFAQVQAWCRDWKMKPFPNGWLPKTAFWVPNVAAGWMYQTDSDVAFVENIISNPNVAHKERNAAVRAVAEAIEQEARRLGYKWLHGSTSKETVATVGRDQGWHVSDFKYAVMVKTLGDE